MSLENTAPGKARWFGQFALYLVLFALLISGVAYWVWGSGEAPPPAKIETPKPAASPSEAPAGIAGHDAPATQSPK